MENEGMQINNNIQTLIKEKINGDIDESTFKIWKLELQKELPIFWEFMNRF